MGKLAWAYLLGGNGGFVVLWLVLSVTLEALELYGWPSRIWSPLMSSLCTDRGLGIGNLD